MKLYIQAAACFFILTLTLVLFCYTGDLFGFRYPFSYHTLNESYNNLNALDSKYRQSQQEYERLSTDYTRLLQIQNEIKAISGGTDWSFHLPSVLVLLEQNAGYFNLEIWIDAVKINEGDRSGNICTYDIPVILTGSYESVRDYLGFLGSVDFILVSNVEVKPADDTISASVSLEVICMDEQMRNPNQPPEPPESYRSLEPPEYEDSRNEHAEDDEEWQKEH